jgi:hypothetical protein
MGFQKGQSGNPAGRPRGSRNKASIRMQEMLEENIDQLVQKALDLALAGNMGALRLCLDRAASMRANEPLVEMPPLAKAGNATGAIAQLASAAAAGDITADEAAKLAKVISLYVDSLQAHEFEERLENLERADIEQFAKASNRAGNKAIHETEDQR